MDQDDLLKKWLNHELSEAEQAAFEKTADFKAYQKIIETAQHFKSNSTDKRHSFEALKQACTAHSRPKRLSISLMWRVAAVLVVALGVFAAFLYYSPSEINTKVAEKTQVVLPDQSVVVLNAYSEIAFSKRNWDKHREVLLKGEAFFKVKPGQTFDVVTKQGKVTVVGTQFNVRQRQDYFEVVCYEGRVRVASDTIVRQLEKGETYRLMHQKFTTGNTSESAPKWLENVSSFDKVPFKDVLAELERQYGVEVEFNPIGLERLFSGGFTHENLESALISITTPMNMTYKIGPDKLVVIHANNN